MVSTSVWVGSRKRAYDLGKLENRSITWGVISSAQRNWSRKNQNVSICYIVKGLVPTHCKISPFYLPKEHKGHLYYYSFVSPRKSELRKLFFFLTTCDVALASTPPPALWDKPGSLLEILGSSVNLLWRLSFMWSVLRIRALIYKGKRLFIDQANLMKQG